MSNLQNKSIIYKNVVNALTSYFTVLARAYTNLYSLLILTQNKYSKYNKLLNKVYQKKKKKHKN